MIFALTISMAGILRLMIASGLLLGAMPAAASAVATVPEPSDLALFVLGLLGVILGYRGARWQKKSDEDRKRKR